jgi:hypothetical protein
MLTSQGRQYAHIPTTRTLAHSGAKRVLMETERLALIQSPVVHNPIRLPGRTSIK